MSNLGGSSYLAENNANMILYYIKYNMKHSGSFFAMILLINNNYVGYFDVKLSLLIQALRCPE